MSFHSGLLGYWKFDETAGLIAYDTFGTNHGTASRTNILNNASGKLGNMGVFASASTDRVDITSTAALKPTSAYTLQGWVKKAASTTYHEIIDSFTQIDAPRGIRLGIDLDDGHDHKACLMVGDGTGSSTFVWGTTSVDDGNWHHIVGTYDGTSIRLYIDGTQEGGDVACSNPSYNATNYVTIGTCQYQTGAFVCYMNGNIDEVAMWNRALNQSEVTELYNSGNGLPLRSGNVIEYVGGTSVVGTNSAYAVSLTSLLGGIGTAPITGDVVVVAVAEISISDQDMDISTYTEVVELYNNYQWDCNLAVYYKVMGAVPDTTFDSPATANSAYASTTCVQVWRYVNNTTVLDVAYTEANGNDQTQPDNASITPSTSDAVVIAIAALTSDDGTPAPTVPTGYLHLVANGSSTPTYTCSTAMASKYWTSGAEDPAAWAGFDVYDNYSCWEAVTLAIRPVVTTIGKVSKVTYASIGKASRINRYQVGKIIGKS